MPSNHWKVRVIATSHVPEVLAKEFKDPPFGKTEGNPVCFMEEVSYMTNEYGWLVYTKNRHKDYAGTPPAGVNKEHWAMALGALDGVLSHFQFDFDFVMFDADGDKYDDLPTFEW